MEIINKNERIWSLLVKCLSGECSEVEEEELKLWKNINKENSTFYFEVNNMLKNINDAMNANDINSEMAWQKVKSRIHNKGAKNLAVSLTDGEAGRKLKRLSLIWRVAASVILIFSIGLGYYLWENRASQIKTLIADGSEIQQVTLPDGTNVAVNGGSVFKYPSAFVGKERNVSLKGEAFFNVTSDKEHPFVVNVEGMVICVLGTSFNIKADEGSSMASVVVESGIVQVTAENKSVLIKIGETALFNRNEGTLTKFTNSDANYIAWKTKQIKFVNTPLTEAFTTIENIYKVKIEIKNDSLLRDKRIDANFDKHSIDFVLKTICDTYHLHYIHEKNKYVIR